MSGYDHPTVPNHACTHKQVTHWHGTHACRTLDACSCADCLHATRRYERERIKRLAGASPATLVDAEPARAVVRDLTARGIGLKTISTHSGVPHGVIWELMYGKNGRPSRRVRPATLTKLETYVRRAEPADCARVDAQEAWLIVDELVARGWTRTAIARRVHGPQAKTLQLGRTQVEYGHLKSLRSLLDDPVPPRSYGRHGPRTVGTDHRWRTLAELTLLSSPPGDLVARRRLVCGVCWRPLVDHRLTERCA